MNLDGLIVGLITGFGCLIVYNLWKIQDLLIEILKFKEVK